MWCLKRSLRWCNHRLRSPWFVKGPPVCSSDFLSVSELGWSSHFSFESRHFICFLWFTSVPYSSPSYGAYLSRSFRVNFWPRTSPKTTRVTRRYMFNVQGSIVGYLQCSPCRIPATKACCLKGEKSLFLLCHAARRCCSKWCFYIWELV